MPVDVTHVRSYLSTPITMLAKNINQRNLVLFSALGPIAADYCHAFVAITSWRLCSCSSAVVPFTCRPVRSVRHAYPHTASLRGRAATDERSRGLVVKCKTPSSFSIHLQCTVPAPKCYKNTMREGPHVRFRSHGIRNAALGDCIG